MSQIDKVREWLENVMHSIGLTDRAIRKSRKRAKKRHAEARGFRHDQQQEQKKADRLREAGHLAAAARHDKKADVLGDLAHTRSMRAQWWVGRTKRLLQKKHGLKQKQSDFEATLKKLGNVEVVGNTVKGGEPHERLRAGAHAAAANCANGTQRNYYSQSGAMPDHSHTIQGMPYGHRFDCSSFADGLYECCDLPNPSRTTDGSGYTGTEGAHGTAVALSECKGGELVLYGPYPHHHVEVLDKLDPNLPGGGSTIGHGSAPIDAGVIDLFGDRNYVIRQYV